VGALQGRPDHPQVGTRRHYPVRQARRAVLVRPRRGQRSPGSDHPSPHRDEDHGHSAARRRAETPTVDHPAVGTPRVCALHPGGPQVPLRSRRSASSSRSQAVAHAGQERHRAPHVVTCGKNYSTKLFPELLVSTSPVLQRTYFTPCSRSTTSSRRRHRRRTRSGPRCSSAPAGAATYRHLLRRSANPGTVTAVAGLAHPMSHSHIQNCGEHPSDKLPCAPQC